MIEFGAYPKLSGTLTIPPGQPPHLYFNSEQQCLLIKQAVWLLWEKNFTPDWVISLTNGGAFIGPIIARCFNLNTAYWSASTYDVADFSKAGRRRKHTTLASHITWVAPNGSAKELPPQLTGNVLVVDDLVDTNATLPSACRELKQRYGDGFTLRTLCLWRKKNGEAAPAGDFIVMDVDPESSTNKVPWIDQWHERLVVEIQKELGFTPGNQ